MVKYAFVHSGDKYESSMLRFLYAKTSKQVNKQTEALFSVKARDSVVQGKQGGTKPGRTLKAMSQCIFPLKPM